MNAGIHSTSSKVPREEEDGNIFDHLRNHVHLTNCIHLKNHMHKNSPISSESSLTRDLVVLQRSRSLRDPSSSPSWHSPAIESLARKVEREGSIQGARKSVGFERRRDLRRGSTTSSPPSPIFETSLRVTDGATTAAAEALSEDDRVEILGNPGTATRLRDGERNKGGESSKKNHISEFQTVDISGNGVKPRDVHKARAESNPPVDGLVSRKFVSRNKKISQNGNCGKSLHRERVSGIPLANGDVESSSVHHCGRHIREEKTSEAGIQGYYNESSNLGTNSNRVEKLKFKSIKKVQVHTGSRREIGARNELSVASNSLIQGASHPRYCQELQGMGGRENAGLEFSQAPRNGCVIPWNWSRIHHRGKTYLDMAGRSFSCGLSDSRLRRARSTIPEGHLGSQRKVPVVLVASDQSSSCMKSNSEVLPLLTDPSGSQESTENFNWVRDYSGELGIYADHILKDNQDLYVASHARSGDKCNSSGYFQGKQRLQLVDRHQSLTHKYMPKTFKDLVGQNLVVQALCNAVMRRKVGLLYVFYGPHGTGKTSCARIFAKALNCQSAEHPRPCGVCNCCIAQDMGKSRNVQEVDPVGNFDFKSSMNLFENMVRSQLSSQYRVFIVDDCDTLPTDSWSTISKVIDRSPRRVVFILGTTSLEHLPHVIISRCQKFFFPKLKDADIIYTLQWIATKEDLEIDKDALKLIASMSGGSLRDAEMTLDQLSLLGQRISLPLVQELVGLISDEKLVDLLDLALAADTVNTVKCLREIIEVGVEPLALMSQLATIITNILAGSYVFTRERLRRKFFRRPTLSKEDMERLREALKTLSGAEKQLRLSNDRLTWLTAVLLQLAPDKNYMLPNSSADPSFSHSPMGLNYTSERDLRKSNGDHAEAHDHGGGLSPTVQMDNLNAENASDAVYNEGSGNKEIEDIWESVLEKIQSNTLKQFMHQEGKLLSVSFGAAPTVQLLFGSQVNKSKVEKYMGNILQTFESVFGSPVSIEIRCEPRKDMGAQAGTPVSLLAADKDGAQRITKLIANDGLVRTGPENHIKKLSKDRGVSRASSFQATRLHSGSQAISKNEIVEVTISPYVCVGREHVGDIAHLNVKSLESAWVEGAYSYRQLASGISLPERRKHGEQPQMQSLAKGGISIAHVIQQECTQQSGLSKRKAISIAEKLEQENLRLEPRSRNLLCWKASQVTRGKLPRLRMKTRKLRSLSKLVPCSIGLCAKSPR